MSKSRLPPGDDGRTIVSMDALKEPSRHEHGASSVTPIGPPPSSKETWWVIAGALKAALLIFVVFATGIVLFVLLLLYLWR